MRGAAAIAVLALAAALAGPAARPALSRDAPPSVHAPAATRWVSGGIAVDFSLEPLAPPVPAAPGAPVIFHAGDAVRFRFTVTDTAGRTPLAGLAPGAWVDAAGRPAPEAAAGTGASATPADTACAAKIAGFVGGELLATPALSLNGYVVVAMNEDASLSVLDPTGGFGGTRLLAMVPLAVPAADWALAADQARLYAALPAAGEVAVIDTAAWKVVGHLPLSLAPARLALEPGERRLWVLAESGAATVGAVALPAGTVTPVAVGAGPHRIAFAADGRKAYVTNAGDGTVSIVDTRSLREIQRLPAGRRPSAVAVSPLARAAYVASGEDGAVTVVDGERDAVVATLAAEPGLGELRFAPGGRYGFLLNRERDLVHVIDAAARRIVQTGKVEREPDQVVFSDTLAYIRHRGSENVLLVPLEKVGAAGQRLPVGDFPGGRAAFGAGRAASAADGFAKVPGMNAMLVANPADRTVYFYKEGMAAPMGDLEDRPHEPRAVLAVDRSLREVAPGVYETTATLPRVGRFDVAFFVAAPRLVHCFALAVAPREGDAPPTSRRIAVEPLFDGLPSGRLVAGQPAKLQARLTDRATGQPVAGAADLAVLLTATGSNWSARHPAAPRGAGLYEAEVQVPAPGIYYVYFVSPSLGLAIRGARPLVLAAAKP
jgi:YVTN family beta-propeller protein